MATHHHHPKSLATLGGEIVDPESAVKLEMRYVHPCEKVMELFIQHRLFIFYLLKFILVFIRDKREVVNINYANFYWISITVYIPVKLWKWQLDQNPTSRLSDQCNVNEWHRNMGKTTVIGV